MANHPAVKRDVYLGWRQLFPWRSPPFTEPCCFAVFRLNIKSAGIILTRSICNLLCNSPGNMAGTPSPRLQDRPPPFPHVISMHHLYFRQGTHWKEQHVKTTSAHQTTSTFPSSDKQYASSPTSISNLVLSRSAQSVHLYETPSTETWH